MSHTTIDVHSLRGGRAWEPGRELRAGDLGRGKEFVENLWKTGVENDKSRGARQLRMLPRWAGGSKVVKTDAKPVGKAYQWRSRDGGAGGKGSVAGGWFTRTLALEWGLMNSRLPGAWSQGQCVGQGWWDRFDQETRMTSSVCRKQRSGLRWAQRVAAVLVVMMGAVLWAQPGGPGAPAAETKTPVAKAAPVATEAAAAVPGIDPATGKLPTFAELFNTSPVINGIIGMLSVIALLLFVYFLLTINTRSMMPAMFLDEVTKLAIAGRYEEAANFCRNQRNIFSASILQRCFENADKEPSHLLSVIESEGQRRADLVWNRISYLMDLSSLAPMLGLLGTVLGMLYAFFGLNTTAAGVGSKVLAQSIGGAMTATFMGLAVAIVTVIFHSIIKSRTIATLADVEHVVHSIADHITRKPGGAR